jgi:hypothetical protein
MIIIATIGVVFLAFVFIQIVSWLCYWPKPKRQPTILNKIAVLIEADTTSFNEALRKARADFNRRYWPTRRHWRITNNERGSVIDSLNR